jgi:hypothetical protein
VLLDRIVAFDLVREKFELNKWSTSKLKPIISTSCNALLRYLHEHRIVVNRLEKKIWLNPDGISKLTLIGITKVKNIAKDDLQEQDRSAFIRSLNLKIHGQSKNGYWFDQDAINGILKSASPKSYSLEEQCDNMK